jgi:ABC-type transport system involved in multi-copper enzyme maturation permease subunit
MRVNRWWIFLTVTAILTIAIAGFGKASTAKMAVNPADVKDIEPGGTFNVNVTVTDVSDLFEWKFLIRFDHEVLQVENVTEGPFLGSTGEETIFPAPTINNTKGFVIAGSTFMVPLPEEGVTGDGVLATIAFNVTGQGTTDLEFDEELSGLTEVRWVNYTAKLGDTKSILHTLFDGTFSNGTPAILSPLIVIAIVVAVAFCGIATFYYMRRRRT